MSNSVHGHDVMALMVAQGAAIIKPELLCLMGQQFGFAARYHTCSAADLSAEALIQLLIGKGKFHETPQGIELAAGRKCEH
ncbi:YecH family metal-binding protein [Shewanella baltica]|uniref:YecH family metal-binding protein n=1 Tax=Shewanella baltica TaxID=62322 RepID=UPI00217CF302|nr:YecH family metal-binding protein [Shewanella baltica]MCS6209508.1 YecH family protein [Shewanella baltica]